jgi:predicted ATPase
MNSPKTTNYKLQTFLPVIKLPTSDCRLPTFDSSPDFRLKKEALLQASFSPPFHYVFQQQRSDETHQRSNECQ